MSQDASPTESRPLTLQELPELRRKTEAVSHLLHEQLTQHLDTIRPLLTPDRLLGKHATGTGDIVWGDKAMAELEQKYQEYGKPFRLPPEFSAVWLSNIGNRLELQPWEYLYEAPTPQGAKPITMTSPVRWIVTYGADLTISQFKRMLTGQEQRRPEAIRQFIVNTIVLQMIMAKNHGLLRLFAELRYQWQAEPIAALQNLPIATLSFSLPSFRPADDLILAAVGFSGIPAFVELLDLAAVHQLTDPVKARLEELIA